MSNFVLMRIAFCRGAGYVWTAENDSNTLRVDVKIFASAKNYLRKKRFPDTCGHGLICNANHLNAQSLDNCMNADTY